MLSFRPTTSYFSCSPSSLAAMLTCTVHYVGSATHAWPPPGALAGLEEDGRIWGDIFGHNMSTCPACTASHPIDLQLLPSPALPNDSHARHLLTLSCSCPLDVVILLHPAGRQNPSNKADSSRQYWAVSSPKAIVTQDGLCLSYRTLAFAPPCQILLICQV